jgi:hypothetical protein
VMDKQRGVLVHRCNVALVVCRVPEKWKRSDESSERQGLLVDHNRWKSVTVMGKGTCMAFLDRQFFWSEIAIDPGSAVVVEASMSTSHEILLEIIFTRLSPSPACSLTQLVKHLPPGSKKVSSLSTCRKRGFYMAFGFVCMSTCRKRGFLYCI